MKAKDIFTLSSGTLAGIFGVSTYDAVEQEMMGWYAWAEAQGKEWESWVDCLQEYFLTGRT